MKTTRRTELTKTWGRFVKLMRDNCESSTGLEALLNKDTQEVATWIVTMHSGDNAADAARVAQYIGIMYKLEATVQDEIERILLASLHLCLDL